MVKDQPAAVAHDIYSGPFCVEGRIPSFFKRIPCQCLYRAAPTGTCINFNRTGSCLREPCAFRHIRNKCGGPTLGGTVAPPPTPHEADTTAKIPNPVHLVNLSTKGKYYPLPTPVNVNSLEKVLDGHPDRTLVNQLGPGPQILQKPAHSIGPTRYCYFQPG